MQSELMLRNALGKAPACDKHVAAAAVIVVMIGP